MLCLENLSKCYGPTRAVDRVNLTIPKGQFIGVIGRSGAGKSTLLRLINRLTEPTGGAIRSDVADICALKGRGLLEWRAHCAMIFQQFNLIGRLDVLTNVLVGRLSYRGTLPSLLRRFTAAERVLAIRALDRLDLADKAFARADTLSGGQQQRVAIARALVQEPRIILADEPIASLDPRSAVMVMDALRRVCNEDGITVLCNLHTLDAARSYCDRIVGMTQGAVTFDGSPAALATPVLEHIYGADSDMEFGESVTATSLRTRLPSPAAAA